jgi:hypothetical protein
MFTGTTFTAIILQSSKPSFISILFSISFWSVASSPLSVSLAGCHCHFVGAIPHLKDLNWNSFHALRGGNVDTLYFFSFLLYTCTSNMAGTMTVQEYLEHVSIFVVVTFVYLHFVLLCLYLLLSTE